MRKVHVFKKKWKKTEVILNEIDLHYQINHYILFSIWKKKTLYEIQRTHIYLNRISFHLLFYISTHITFYIIKNEVNKSCVIQIFLFCLIYQTFKHLNFGMLSFSLFQFNTFPTLNRTFYGIRLLMFQCQVSSHLT